VLERAVKGLLQQIESSSAITFSFTD